MALSDLAAKKAKPKERPYKLSDEGGLYLHVQPNGSKLWRLKYRFFGKEKLLSFGPYPVVSLADAREKREDAKRLLVEGKDPSVQKKLDKIAAANAAENTFGKLAGEYLQNMEANGAAQATLNKTRWMLLDIAAPLSRRPINDISAAEILDLLKRVEKSGRRETARRLRGTIGAVFRLAIATLRAETDPTFALRGALLAPKRVGRAAITDETKLGGLLHAIDGYDGWPTISAALNFLMLTCVRPGEVRGARREELDLENAVWKIPPERMKMRQEHRVPLSSQALEVVHSVWPMSDGADLVFPSIRTNRKPLSENALNSALRRMGYAKDEVTAHGFRATASSILNDRGYDPDVIEAALAHQDRNSIRRTYNRATYWEQRKVLMQDWADLLDGLRS